MPNRSVSPSRSRSRGRHRSSSYSRDRRHRSRSPRRRSRSRSPRRENRDRPRSSRSKERRSRRSKHERDEKEKKQDVSTVPGEVDEDTLLKQMFGFSSFDSTKGKKVEKNISGLSQVHKKRKYRQYMNRRGGFNRPLDPIV